MQRCFIIPIYNHGETIETTVQGLTGFGYPIFIVDDGSDEATKAILERLAAKEPLVRLHSHSVNKGKGGAVMTGISAASEQGFTHALQVDADGQHDLSDIKPMWALSKKYPESLISGQPQYDESIPRGRRIGRHITHVWVWIETLSFEIRDTMCGFRVYPLAPCVDLMARKRLGERMDFDIEIMVRLYWQGLSIRFYPTRVIYPEDGSSHFQGFRDNVRISWLHTRLFFGMLLRAPMLLFWRKGKGDG
ncbi:glycosyltransferase family 2 protein [Aliidiomarina indica]|uniref:glycosyltransferase family 2 protein n=1 Tax=Aliidiomarina indica TaxID=2749147 RepID=UPI00188DE8BC|nr:glycosyltransferase family 2 protein [Aliidiomarina indica]